MGNENKNSSGVAVESPRPALERRVEVLEIAVQVALSGLVGILQASAELNINASKSKSLIAQLESLCDQLAIVAKPVTSEQNGSQRNGTK